VKVIAPETSNWNSEASYMTDTYNSPAATARLDVAAAHLYGGDPSRAFQDALAHGKKIWQTEASLRFSVEDIDGALSWATAIHQGLTKARVSAWVWWVLALWFDQALIHLDDDSTGAFRVGKTLWALGNFSRFIRPGFVRIGTTSQAPTLLTSAYKDPGAGQFVIVAINTGTAIRRSASATSGSPPR
jgi:glucuronoarabinoxylan endo-1,4-beta-xylanase